MTLPDKEVLVRYVLGDLSPLEHEQLEREALASSEVRDAIEGARNDLMDSYVRGALSEKQKQQFEERLLDSNAKFEDLEVAMLLMDPAVRTKIKTAPMGPERPWYKSLFLLFSRRALVTKLALASAGLAVVAAVFLEQREWRLRTQVTQMNLEQVTLQQQIAVLKQRLQNAGTAPEQGSSSPPAHPEAAQLSTANFLLMPGTTRQAGRSNTDNRVKVPPRSLSVNLMLKLNLKQDQYHLYEIELDTVDRTNVLHTDGLTSQQSKDARIVVAPVPSRSLPKGDYIITLFGHTAEGRKLTVYSLSFSVVP